MEHHNKIKANAVFLSHGGGPLPLLNDVNHQEMIEVFKEIANIIIKPKAIAIISAHWEEDKVQITGNEKPELIYDYSGFPQESYEIQYSAPGNPELAEKISFELGKYNIESKVNLKRGWDHGVFVPLKLIYPNADIPCIQIALLNHLNPKKHIDLGKALRNILDEDVLLLGSGFTFHNMSAFFSKLNREQRMWNQNFENWLFETLTTEELSCKDREDRLINWEAVPGARFCHPREEHLLPLHVCYGYAEKAAGLHFQFEVLDILTSAFIWEI